MLIQYVNRYKLFGKILFWHNISTLYKDWLLMQKKKDFHKVDNINVMIIDFDFRVC